MPLLPLLKVIKSLNAAHPFVQMALGEAFLVGLYVFDSRPRLSRLRLESPGQGARRAVFNLFDGNLQAEQRGNDVVRSVVIYEAGQSFDAVTGCTEPESA